MTSPSHINVPAGTRLIIATHNQKKLSELQAILADAVPQLDSSAIISAAGLGVDEPIEDGVTFTDNAFIKARALCSATGLPVVADDSGLAVDIMGGAPGIFSARWAGKHGDDSANLQLLIDQLADVEDPHRAAAFICAAVLVTPSGQEKSVIGEMRGRLIKEPRGNNGFGYDPIFIPDGCEHTTAQMSADDKHAMSHRGKALRILAPFIGAALGYEMTEIRN